MNLDLSLNVIIGLQFSTKKSIEKNNPHPFLSMVSLLGSRSQLRSAPECVINNHMDTNFRQTSEKKISHCSIFLLNLNDSTIRSLWGGSSAIVAQFYLLYSFTFYQITFLVIYVCLSVYTIERQKKNFGSQFFLLCGLQELKWVTRSPLPGGQFCWYTAPQYLQSQ